MVWHNLKRLGLLSILLMPRHPAVGQEAIHGLVTMGKLDPYLTRGEALENTLAEASAHPGVYAAAVVFATWAELEPSPQDPLDTRKIDQGLHAIAAYNARYPRTPLVAKLRIFTGKGAPDWAKSIGGEPIIVPAHRRVEPFAIGRYWTDAYKAAWRNFNRKLAAIYDGRPLIREVAVTSCSINSAEPFVLPWQRDSISIVLSAGYSDQQEFACLDGAIDDYSVWKHVALDYTFNVFHALDSGRVRNRPDLTVQVMQDWRRAYGSRAVLANHNLASTILPHQREMFSELARLGPPIEFQTLGPEADWVPALTLGVDTLHATEIEVFDTKDSGGAAPITGLQLREFAGKLDR